MELSGLVIVTFGLLLSEMFEGEFTAAVVGICLLTCVSLSYKAHTLHGWNVFDVMSATAASIPRPNFPVGRRLGLVWRFA